MVATTLTFGATLDMSLFNRVSSVSARDRSPDRPRQCQPADHMLVAAARRGDMKAFESLYRVHSPKVMGLCLRMLKERDDAEDCVQQTFIKAWRNLHTFAGRSAFSTWLHSIAVHVVMEHLRGRKTWLEFESDLSQDDLYNDDTDGHATAAARGGEDALSHDTGQLLDIEQLLASLPEGARFVVILQGIYGYSHEEVADMLGIAVGTCKAQLHRARALLRARYMGAEQP